MLDIRFIRENLDLVKSAAKNKNRQVDWDALLKADERRRQLITQVDELRKRRNELSSDKTQAQKNAKEAKQLKADIKSLEEELRSVQSTFDELMLTVPNVPDEVVPVGKDENDNVEIKSWGTKPAFDFQPRDHIELARSLDLIDFDRGVKVSGFRGYFLKNEAAEMELALMHYALRKLVAKGYTPMTAPVLLKEFTLYGIAQFPWGRDEVYHLEKDELYLAGTAEQPVTSYHADEVLDESELPKKYVAFSPCFRREAGSYGKDTKGVYRIHQFNKVEQVIIGPNDMDHSRDMHEELLANSEEILQDLKLPYRVLLMCTGDMGEPQVKKYDIETWMPGRETSDGPPGAYGETMSNSIMGEFQARRLKIRYRDGDGEIKYCHTLNNTALASPRILVAIFENYQQKDGSIRVPDVLQPMLGKDIIKRQ